MEQTIDQRRAAHAWKTVEQAKTVSNKDDFARAVMSLPAQIIGSGLGPALAFVKAKATTKKELKEALLPLLQAVSDWVLGALGERPDPAKGDAAPDDVPLLERFREADAVFLRRATAETLAYLQWLKRFTEAEIGKGGA